MKVKGMISEAPPRSSLTEGAPQRSGEGSWAEERGGEGGGCYSSRMEMGEEAVFKTAGFRVLISVDAGEEMRVSSGKE